MHITCIYSLGDGIVYNSRNTFSSDYESGMAQSNNAGAYLLNDKASIPALSSGNREQETEENQINNTSVPPSDANFYKISISGDSHIEVQENRTDNE